MKRRLRLRFVSCAKRVVWLGRRRILSVLSFRAGGRQIEVSYYLVWFIGNAPADEARETRWLTFDAARSALTYEDARRYVDAVERMVRER